MYRPWASAAALLSILSCVLAADWSYHGDHGPSRWHVAAAHCNGKRQSPIDIKTDQADTADLGKFSFSGYDHPPAGTTYKLKNNGHTVQMDVRYDAGEPTKITVHGGGLNDTYLLAQFHMHWGKDNCEGSEHTANGLHYPLEIHFVHYNSKYPNIGEALHHEDGLAVLGVMADIGATAHPTIDTLQEYFHSVKYAGSSTDIKEPLFAMQSLLPSNTDNFVRYPGSLTTPPCLEIVTWTVFTTPISVSESQMNAFRALSLNKLPAAGDGTAVSVTDLPLDINFRPILPLNGRTVTKTFTGGPPFRPSGKICAAQLRAVLGGDPLAPACAPCHCGRSVAQQQSRYKTSARGARGTKGSQYVRNRSKSRSSSKHD